MHQGLTSRAGKGRRPFASAGAEPRYAPDLPFRMEHLVLDLTLDPVKQSVTGSVIHRLKVVDSSKKTIVLDQGGLEIQSGSIDGKSAEFRKEDEKLTITIPATTTLKEGATIELKIEYSVSKPRRGLYFTGPDEHFPKKPYQVWSQGQDQDSHYWFPTFDYPNQRTTVETIVRVPEGYTALSNGVLVSQKGSEFHYSMKQPIVVYLITLVVGKFAGWKDKGPRGLPVEYYVVPGREEEGKRSFSSTPQMIEAFEKKIGVSFPYDKYSQVAVQDFIFGGMENASATTQTDLTLHDERAHLDFSSDPLVSHELAHQWFGDLVTCKDWSHAWLNEGFATFMERVWVECDTGPNGGPEEAKYYAYQELKDYLDEDGGQYRRSIVCNTYSEPIELFDRHLYQKGGLVLNLVRSTLGETDFWKAIRHYVTENQNRAVETIDLIRAIEETTGKNLRRLFNEWVFSAGHPDFEVTYSWKELKEESGFVTPLFRTPIWVEFCGDAGQVLRHQVEFSQVKERVLVPCAFTPKMVRFDPDFAVPKTLKFTRPREMLAHQLANDPDCMGRIDAAKEIAKLADLEAVKTLAQVVQSDAFWAVQAEAALALSEIRLDAARDALILALKSVQHPKARKSIVRALGSFKEQKAAEALRAVATKDVSYQVEAEATTAFVSASLSGIAGGGSALAGSVESFLLEQRKKRSYREFIRRATYRAMSSLPGIERGERPQALEALMAGARAGETPDSRMGAIYALGEVASRATPSVAHQILEALRALVEEEGFFIRTTVVNALEITGLAEAIPLLSRVRLVDADGRVRRHALWAIETIQSGFSTPDSIGQVKKELETLQSEYQKLRSAVEDLKIAQKPAGK